MTGLERNSDIVFAASYAPLLQVCFYLFTSMMYKPERLLVSACERHAMGTSFTI